MLRQDMQKIAQYAESESAQWNVSCRVVLDPRGLLVIAKAKVRDKVCKNSRLIPWVELSAQYGDPTRFVCGRICEVVGSVKQQVDKELHKK